MSIKYSSDHGVSCTKKNNKNSQTGGRSMRYLQRLQIFSTISLLLISRIISAETMQCPDMSQYTGKLPLGWHARFNKAIVPDETNALQLIIFELVDKKDKNNFYCRYISRNGATFVLSRRVLAKNLVQSHKRYWSYDNTDNLWECHPRDRVGKLNLSQCAFSA